jgi:hypothetical protein
VAAQSELVVQIGLHTPVPELQTKGEHGFWVPSAAIDSVPSSEHFEPAFGEHFLSMPQP